MLPVVTAKESFAEEIIQLPYLLKYFSQLMFTGDSQMRSNFLAMFKKLFG
jgi:hypothetical protein